MSAPSHDRAGGSALQFTTLRIGPGGRAVNSQVFDAVEEVDSPAHGWSDLRLQSTGEDGFAGVQNMASPMNAETFSTSPTIPRDAPNRPGG